ncbi:MAG: DUF5050 domain-containing protein [Clostridia bacterium]|nr:DUF5050 domain-containing protein [Clostridia bacterium]
MKIKKLFLLGIVLLLSVILLAGCGDKEEEKKEESKDQTKYSNLGNFAEYDGNLYYWKLTASSREDSALFANYGIVIGAKNDLVKRDSNGKETTILTDTGSGNLYIANNKIFYQLNENGEYNVYSMDLDGNNKKSYIKGEIKYADGKYLYIQSTKDIAVIDVDEDLNVLTVDDSELIGMAGSYAYFVSGDSSKEISIGYISEGVPTLNVALFKTTDYKITEVENANITLYEFSYEKNKVTIKFGDVQGTGHFVQEGWAITMNADGSDIKKEQDNNQAEESVISLYDIEGPVAFDVGKGIVYTENGATTTIIPNAQVKSEFGFKLTTDDSEDITEVYTSCKSGDKLYIIMDNATHNPAEDVGWRYSYKRLKTAAYSYDLKNNKIEKIYEF